MTKIRWVIDPVLVSHSVHSRKLPAAITNAGHELVTAEYDEASKKWKELDLIHNVPTVFYGSHKFVRDHSLTHVPGSFGANDRTRVSHYMTNLPREWFLNSQALMTTWGDFCNRTSYWLGMSGGPAFLRPESGRKPFAGLVVQPEDVAHEINSINQLSRMAPEDLVWVARAKEIQGEFRFVIANGRVVAGSEYRWDSVLDIRSDYPEECRAVAQRVAEHEWQVDRVYTCDVALTEFGPKVVELNGFSSAGLYACDLDAVVAAVSEAAILEWDEIYI